MVMLINISCVCIAVALLCKVSDYMNVYIVLHTYH